MTADHPTPDAEPADADVARAAWLELSDLVLDNTRRRAVSEATGMSFGHTRALRRLARRPRTMREFAEAMDIDPPNATVVVDRLEQQGLVERRPHPTDRRAKLVVLTAEGQRIAETASAILATPPAGLEALADAELAELRRLLAKIAGASTPSNDPAGPGLGA